MTDSDQWLITDSNYLLDIYNDWQWPMNDYWQLLTVTS